MHLSLDCLTLTDTSPAELIRCAAAAGFDLVSLWLNPPVPFPNQLMTPAMARECMELMAGTSVRAHCMEAFDLVSVAAMRACRPSLELGAQFGCKAVLAYHGANPDRTEAAETLAALVELAGEYGLGVNLEPVAFARTRTLAEAEHLILDAVVDAGIIFDTLYLVRNGGSVDDLKSLPPGRIRYVQINDGIAHMPPEDMLAEASGERLYPGEGVFPLAEMLREAPRDVPWGVEAPSLRRARAGITPQNQAREAMAAMRNLLDSLGDAEAGH
jgi:sugar phosphate isomerase/epimerase